MMTHLTTEEAATRLRQSSAQIARRCADGTIPAARVGGRWLIAESVIDRMLQPTNTRIAAAQARSTAGRRRSA